MKRLVWLALALVAPALLVIPPATAAAQPPAPAPQPLRAVAGRSFYLAESQGEVLLLGEDRILRPRSLRADVLLGDTYLAKEVRPLAGRRLLVPFDLTALPLGDSDVTCLLRAGKEERRLPLRVTKLAPKPNAVQLDRVSGGLLVDGLPFFPFGFYNYWPVQPTLAEEEVVKGFNLMSPYHGNQPELLADRLAYLDRAAQLGMKVHYHIKNIAVLGGDPAKEQALRAEVTAVRDHPALLAWYLSDEPEYNKIAPEELTRSYAVIRELDPYHPITIVFAQPEAARTYAAAMDLVMTDPYPIPRRPPTAAYDAIAGLMAQFGGEKPVWIVPQAFGGNEWWQREPTAREERVMTYLGLIGGATGVQYFVRHGLNGFPKSTVSWGECGRLALEVAELTPALLSREARPTVMTGTDALRAAAWRDRNLITILAVNTQNQPARLRLKVLNLAGTHDATVLFENRTVPMKRGKIDDLIDAYGTRAYQIQVGPPPRETLTLAPKNLILDPSFEGMASYGTPESCYAGVGSGRGATYFTDSRVARQGRHSVRLTQPNVGETLALELFPVQLTEGNGYRFSVWAKAAPPATPDGAWPTLRLSLRGVGEQSFPLTAEWQECVLSATYAGKWRRPTPEVALTTTGTAWVDAVQVLDQGPAVPANGAVTPPPPAE